MGNRAGSGWEIIVQDTSPESLLNMLAEHQTHFYAAQPLDAVTLCFRVPYGEIRQVRKLLEGRGAEMRLCRPYGLCPKLLRIGKRYALVGALILCGMLLAVSNLFVWQINVVGNETVPTGEIIRAVTKAGGGIGRFWPAFDSEQMRTEMLLMLEDVHWVGLNYHTGAMEVVVRERRKVPEVVDNDEPVHIIAEKAGVLTGLSVKQGQNRVAVGDTVEKGQVLISGAAVSSIGTTRTVHALGDVEARTWYALTARVPAEEQQKVYTGRKSLKLSLILGRKRVNFYSDSSIFGDSCDTIIMDYHLCMDGVFALPIQLVVQECVYWTAQKREADTQMSEKRAQNILMEVLRQQIGEEGSVSTADFASTPRAEGITVTLMAECLEEIGEEVPVSEEELRQIRSDNTLREEATND